MDVLRQGRPTLSDTRTDAFTDVLRDLTGAIRGADTRDRAVAIAGLVAVLVLVAVLLGPAWGVAVLFAATSLLLVQVAVRQRLPEVTPGEVVVASPDRIRNRGGAVPASRERSVTEGVRLAMERPTPLDREIVRIYPTGAFGPAAGVMFGLRVMNHGPRSTFRARLRPLDNGGRTPPEGFDIAWMDTPASAAEIRRGRTRVLRVASAYQDGPRRILRFFSPAVRSHRRDGAGPRSWSVGADDELPPDSGAFRFAVSILDEDMREVATGRFSLRWHDIAANDNELRLPEFTTL